MEHIQLENYVKNLYRNLSITTPDSINMNEIARKMNIHLHYWEETTETICYKGIFRIFLDKRLEDNKRWIAFACELCRVLKKDSQRLNSIPPGKAYLQLRERAFTGHFCVPTFMLDNLKLPLDKEQAVCCISKTFRVERALAEERWNQWLQCTTAYH